MARWSLVAGAFPIVLIVLAIGGAGYLLARRGRRWWTVIVPAIAAGSAAAAIAIAWFVDDVWRAFTDPLPALVVALIGVILAAVALLVAVIAGLSRRGGLGLRRGRAGQPGGGPQPDGGPRSRDWSWLRRGPVRAGLAVLAAALMITGALNGINQDYGYFPTLGDAFGASGVHEAPLPPVQQTGSGPGGSADPGAPGSPMPGLASSAAIADANAPSLRHWRPTGPLPSGGEVSHVPIPGVISGFAARSAWVYLPPAYLVNPRPDLPVLVLIAGQFSTPKNWIIAGQVVPTMDAFAAAHHGIAPIVVMPDALGTTTGKQMCVDSALGRIDTYLSQDVPHWILTHLQVDRNTAHWAIGGFSYGGTCAFTLPIAHPSLYPTFLDISGEVAPTLGSDQYTAAFAFRGDLAAYDAVQPLNILAAGEADPARAAAWRKLDGTFVVGDQDAKYAVQRATVVRACQKAGIAVHEFTEPGSHAWYVAQTALVAALPHLAARMGLL